MMCIHMAGRSETTLDSWKASVTFQTAVICMFCHALMSSSHNVGGKNRLQSLVIRRVIFAVLEPSSDVMYNMGRCVYEILQTVWSSPGNLQAQLRKRLRLN